MDDALSVLVGTNLEVAPLPHVDSVGPAEAGVGLRGALPPQAHELHRGDGTSDGGTVAGAGHADGKVVAGRAVQRGDEDTVRAQLSQPGRRDAADRGSADDPVERRRREPAPFPVRGDHPRADTQGVEPRPGLGGDLWVDLRSTTPEATPPAPVT